MHSIRGAIHSITFYTAPPYSTLLHCFHVIGLYAISDGVIVFQVKQNKFREMFRATAPYSYSSLHPYISLDTVGLLYPLCILGIGYEEKTAVSVQCLPG